MSIVVWSTADCSSCLSAINLLRKEGIEHTVRKVEDPGNDIMELYQKAGRGIRSLPAILIDDKYIGGYAELEKRINSK